MKAVFAAKQLTQNPTIGTTRITSSTMKLSLAESRECHNAETARVSPMQVHKPLHAHH